MADVVLIMARPRDIAFSLFVHVRETHQLVVSEFVPDVSLSVFPGTERVVVAWARLVLVDNQLIQPFVLAVRVFFVNFWILQLFVNNGELRIELRTDARSGKSSELGLFDKPAEFLGIGPVFVLHLHVFLDVASDFVVCGCGSWFLLVF